MGTNYSIFVNTEKSILDVKSQVEKLLGNELKQSEYSDNEHYYAQILGLGVGLLDCHLEDDSIKFSKYKYHIIVDYIRPTFINCYKGEWDVSFCVVLADAVSKHLHCECIVVKNVQEIILRFTPGQEIRMPNPDD